MADSFTVGIIQHECGDDLKANLERGVSGVKEAAKNGAQIVCLQELFRSRYFASTEKIENFDLAEPVEGETVTCMQKLAKELSVAIVVPFFERRAPGVYHNSAAVVDADGSLLGIYRKMHIPHDPLFFEKYYFTPGASGQQEDGFKVFRTRFATIGVLICWDQWYPEGARVTSLMGAEVLFYPTAIGWHPKEKAEFGQTQVESWQTIQRSHAIANGVYVASPNRIGFEPTPGTDGLEFFGHSFICDPFGRKLGELKDGEAGVLVNVCERSRIEDTRRNWPFFRDRRIDAYGPILNRYIGQGR